MAQTEGKEKKILIVSDTHGREETLYRVFQREEPFDLLIHCGDVEGGENDIERRAGCACVMVTGNNDFFSALPPERELQIGEYHAWVTHGHHYYVSMGTERLAEEARQRGVDIVMFGHTHKPYVSTEAGVTLLNPGSLSYPRQEGRRATYMVMTLDEEGRASYEIKYA